MGITIHFEGALKSHDELSVVLQKAREFADAQKWRFVEIPEEVRSLSRVRDEEDWDYAGPTSGVEIYPHDSSEPLRLEFDSNNYIQEYTKTQFAPLDVHIAVVELLRQLKSHFETLEVIDESDYWDTHDVAQLEHSFLRFFEVVEEEKAKNPGLSGPFRLENGRIADLLEN